MCSDLQRDLQGGERYQHEIRLSPKKLEELEIRNATQDFYRKKQSKNKYFRQQKMLGREFICEALAKLTPRQRKCIRLYFWQNYSQNQIGRKLGLSRQTGAQHLQSALEVLRRNYNGPLPQPQKMGVLEDKLPAP